MRSLYVALLLWIPLCVAAHMLGALSFVLHLFGTDLPIMIFIYAILLPRYVKLVSPMTAYLLGAVSYPISHVYFLRSSPRD